MAFRFGYFDSEITGVDDEGMPIFDRAETSDLFALLFANLVSDGVLAQPANCFRVRAAGNGLNLELDPGFGMVKGHFCYNDEVYHLAITAAPQKYNRIDRVIMRCNFLQRMVEIIIKTGTEAANPVAPALLRPTAGDYFELCLANIRLTAGQKVITQSSITDTRPDSAVCGYITQLIDHLDTAIFFEQLNTFYKEFEKQCNQSYQSSQNAMNKYLAELEKSGDGQLKELLENFLNWFNDVQDILNRTDNGELLLEVRNLLKEMYRIATDNDIDRIIAGTYVDEDEENSIFQVGSNQDIDDIIGGTYTDVDESGGIGGNTEIVTTQNMTNIVNNAFKEV